MGSFKICLMSILILVTPKVFGQVEREANWESIIKRINYRMLNVDWRQSSALQLKAPLSSKTTAHRAVLGAFEVNLVTEPKVALYVQDLASERVIWGTRPGHSFIRAGVGNASFSQYRGSFTIKDEKKTPQCMAQSVDDFAQKEGVLEIRGRLWGKKCDTGYVFRLEAQSEGRLAFEIRLSDQSLNRTFFVYASEPDEAFLGFGEQFTHINLKGRKVPIFAQEQGHLRGLMPYTWLLNRISPGSAGAWFSTYTAVPQYITNKNRGLFLEDYEFSLFDLKGKHEVAIRIFKNGMKGQILNGDSPLKLIEAYTEVSGRMKPLPDYLHKGAVVGVMGGSERVRMLYQRLKVNRVPVSAMWLQDWVGKRDTGLGIRMWWNWELDRNSYPDWEELVGEFSDDDVATLGYINPFLSDASTKEGVQTNLFALAKEKGYLTTFSDGSPAEIDSGGFTGTLVDLSNDEARAWLKDYLVKTFRELKIKGWMADFGEALPLDAKLKNAEASSFHNRYLEEWSRLNGEVAFELGDEASYFIRNASLKSPGLTSLFWAGDQMVTWDEHDGLKSAITGILSGGISGMAINHSDIGGLISMKRKVLNFEIDFTRDQELLLRWAEMNAFSPVYRNHEGNNPKKNHQFYSDHRTFKGFAYYARLFSLLYDYRKMLMEEAYATGAPLMRHLFLHYPDDPNIWQVPYQYLFGEDFLVAPVTEPSVTKWSVYLPKGEWVHLASETHYSSEGRTIEVDAPIGYPAVFYRKDSPYGQELQRRLPSIGPIRFP